MARTLICNGGPFDKQPLTLEQPETGSLHFTVNGQTGCYVQRPSENRLPILLRGNAPKEQEYKWEPCNGNTTI